MNLRRSQVVVVSTSIAVLVGLCIFRSDRSEPTASRPGAATSPALPHTMSPQTPADSEIVLSNPSAPLDGAMTNYGKAFSASRDHWEFANTLMGAAKAGDRDAQYYLARALKYCDDNYRFYFVRRGVRRTLDEAMQWASTRTGLSSEEAREVYEKCNRLEEGETHPFGLAKDWLAAAKNSGQELAIVETAHALAIKAGISGEIANSEMREEAKRLAMVALRSKNPDVIFGIGDLTTLFLGDERKASEAQWVWRLAACQRGYDCSATAEWLRFQCRFDFNCQPQGDGIEFIRRNNSQNFELLEARAKELNGKLDANEFDKLFD